jgi:fermentation-respiration switch protein FrsA (DUF1100 family)
MRRWLKWLGAVATLLLLAAVVAVLVRTKAEAHRLLTNPMPTRHLPGRTPIDEGLVYDEATAHTSDGLALAGWFVPGTNGALVLLQHGYKADRGEMLNEAAMLHRHGYNLLITSTRAHDMSDGDLITFGVNEMKDLEAWYEYGRSREGVDSSRIGAVGNSMGGSLVIQYAAQNQNIRAVVAQSAFSSLNDTVETSVRFFTGLPPFPFAPLITFWAEREAGFDAGDIDAKKWIGKLSPRPVFLMQGGADVVISTSSGQKLYDAAREPRELWFDPAIGHARFDTARPEEYERRVSQFFDRYLK